LILQTGLLAIVWIGLLICATYVDAWNADRRKAREQEQEFIERVRAKLASLDMGNERRCPTCGHFESEHFEQAHVLGGVTSRCAAQVALLLSGGLMVSSACTCDFKFRRR
jgi:hypothetical protein